MQQIHDGVETIEGVLPRSRLDLCPAEDVDGDEGDPGLTHEGDILLPHIL